MEEIMKKLFSTMDIPLTDEQEKKFIRFYELLTEWNKRINLTSITEYSEVKVKHFLDSIALLKYVSVNEMKHKSLIDVGTGAGFPGIPLAIMCPELSVTLLDTLNKKITFLNEVVKECGLSNVRTVHGRAEDIARQEEYREHFDYSVSRAVAGLSVLSEYCIPFLKVGGLFLAYKSVKTEEEIIESKHALDLLHADIERVEKFELPANNSEVSSDGDRRSILFIRKNNTTESRYPRRAGKPSKKPL